MGAFGNFALSFSVISILTGAVSLYGYGLALGGPIEMTVGWPLVSVMTLLVARQPGGARLGVPDGGRALSLGVDPRRARARLVDGVAQPDRAGGGARRASTTRSPSSCATRSGIADDAAHLHLLGIYAAGAGERTACSTTSASAW